MIFDTSPPFDAPVRKGSRSEPEYFHNVQYERTKMVGVPDGEKKIRIMLIRFDTCMNYESPSRS